MEHSIDKEKIIQGFARLSTLGVPDCAEGSCPFWQVCVDGEGCYFDMFPSVLTLLKEQEIRWIPVTEKLPELNQRVLVYDVGKIDGFIGEHVIEICSRFVQRFLPSSPGYETWSSPYQYFHTDYEITHWMPLPEPPKENDNEK